ncbi:hypothetical protein [Flavobacterium noncentrifugens]|nr:hypothetical protein [Flavobacterium noncentrifugens]
MENTFAGKGGKKPQIEIKVDQILLDNRNPRLIQYVDDVNSITQLELTKILYDSFDTEAIALSLIQNGYFDEEPVIVVPNNLPSGFKFSDFSYDELTEKLANLSEDGLTFTVVEGNRRISSIKMLLDDRLRSILGIDKVYPKVDDEEIKKDIAKIPCIVYENRKEVSSYLGVRHIAGLLKWEAFAKAAYISNTIEEKLQENNDDQNQAINEVQKIVGDRSDSLKKQFVSYKMYIEALHDLEKFDTKPILDKFSLLTVVYNSPAIREYIGIESYNKIDFNRRVIPSNKIAEFENVLTWVFGNKNKGKDPVLTDSRKITSQLSHVVSSSEAIKYLDRYGDLEGAYERTNGEKEFLIRNLSKAFRNIQESLSFAYKFKNEKDILDKVQELEEVVQALKSNLKS